MSDQHLSNKAHKARKRHQCHGCGGAIEVGEQYVRDVAVWQGEISSIAWHGVCRDRAQEIANREGSFEGDVGFLNETHEPPVPWFAKEAEDGKDT